MFLIMLHLYAARRLDKLRSIVQGVVDVTATAVGRRQTRVKKMTDHVAMHAVAAARRVHLQAEALLAYSLRRVRGSAWIYQVATPPMATSCKSGIAMVTPTKNGCLLQDLGDSHMLQTKRNAST